MNLFLEWLKTATWQKLLIGAVSGLLVIVGWTFWENRQQMYERAWGPVTKGDWPLEEPTDKGKALLVEFSRIYPSIGMIAVVDADPISNTRKAVYRHFNNKAVERLVKQAEEKGVPSSGLLYGSDPETNRLTLAVFNAQVLCERADTGFFAKTYPEATRLLGTSCRVPLPPLYGMTTGWVTIHFTNTFTPEAEITNAMLNLALAYYRTEISPHQR